MRPVGLGVCPTLRVRFTGEQRSVIDFEPRERIGEPNRISHTIQITGERPVLLSVPNEPAFLEPGKVRSDRVRIPIDGSCDFSPRERRVTILEEEFDDALGGRPLPCRPGFELFDIDGEMDVWCAGEYVCCCSCVLQSPCAEYRTGLPVRPSSAKSVVDNTRRRTPPILPNICAAKHIYI